MSNISDLPPAKKIIMLIIQAKQEYNRDLAKFITIPHVHYASGSLTG